MSSYTTELLQTAKYILNKNIHTERKLSVQQLGEWTYDALEGVNDDELEDYLTESGEEDQITVVNPEFVRVLMEDPGISVDDSENESKPTFYEIISETDGYNVMLNGAGGLSVNSGLLENEVRNSIEERFERPDVDLP